MIVDCHGHFTTTPPAHQTFRDAQLDRLRDPRLPPPEPAAIGDDELRAAIEPNQLRLMDERGIDVTLFSPRASGMEHHVADLPTAEAWARACNDLVHRVTTLYPERFVGVCQLPQVPGVPVATVIPELDRCVEGLGCVGLNLNPDPSGGHWTSPPLTDEYWFPLYDRMVELDVPAMIHVSASCNPVFHATGAHYLNADTTAFMQFVGGDLFSRYPDLRFVIPHGGGAVPYHWGRYRGLANRLGQPPPAEHVMGNVWFDTCVYHQAGIDLLLEVIDPANVLFASEMIGAVRGADPDTGIAYDDTRRYVDNVALDDADRARVFEGNARRVYPRLAGRLGG